MACYSRMIEHRANLGTWEFFGYALPNQSCTGMLICVYTHAEHLAGLEAPTAGKAEISSLSLCFSLGKACK